MDSRPFTVLSLCAGVGGLDLGVRLAEPSARTVCFVEIEAYACAILAARMAENALDPAPVWTNLRTFDGKPWRGTVDCITAGYPCQPFSVAGKQRGAEDPRHLWPDVFRVVREIRPAFCFFENVGGHLRLGFEQVHDDLRSVGYCVKAGLFTAQEVGAPHKRERLFILAYAESAGDEREAGNIPAAHGGSDGSLFRFADDASEFVADGTGLLSQRPCPERDCSGQSEETAGGLSRLLADPDSTGFQETRPELQPVWSGGEQLPVGNAEHDGSPAATLSRSDGENAGADRPARGADTAQQSTGTDCLANTACAENVLGESGTLAGTTESRTGFNATAGHGGDHVADRNDTGCQEQCRAEPVRAQHQALECGSSFTPFPPGPDGDWDGIPQSLEPAICRMADGLAHRVDRIRACGNGVVPLAAAYAWRTLMARVEAEFNGEM